MDIKFSDGRIELTKDLSALDRFVLDTTALLDKAGIKYVLVSGYVSILFGRNRASEDIDMLIGKTDIGVLERLWKGMGTAFWCINSGAPKEAYEDYLSNGSSIRLARKESVIPNAEIKFCKNDLDSWTLEHRKEVLLNGHKIFISPLELQIPFKLLLGSEKDIEDARFLYTLFKGRLDKALMREFERKLKVEEMSNKYLGK